jgi:hypothetical protein
MRKPAALSITTGDAHHADANRARSGCIYMVLRTNSPGGNGEVPEILLYQKYRHG